MASLKLRRLQNVSSSTRAALKRAGISTVPARDTAPLSSVWSDLLRYLNDPRLRNRLSRFAHWCSARQVEPAAVSDLVIDEFVRALENSLIEGIHHIHRATSKYWNQAVDQCAAWPRQRVSVPSYATRYSLPWGVFRPSLKQDVDTCLLRLSDESLFTELDHRPLRPSTLRCREYDLRQSASALVLRGHDPAGLRSLADLVEVEAVKDALRFFLERSGNQRTGRIHGLAYTLKAIAKHWVKVPRAHLDELEAICRQLNPRRRGMTDKNRRLLRQFDQPENLAALITLPQRILAEVRRKKSLTRTDAMLVQIALALEILIMLAPRLGNLVALR
jgi:hypothetical protein